MTRDQYRALVMKRDSLRITLDSYVCKIEGAENILHKIDDAKRLLTAVENDKRVVIRAYDVSYRIDLQSDEAKQAMLAFLDQTIEDLEKEFADL